MSATILRHQFARSHIVGIPLCPCPCPCPLVPMLRACTRFHPFLYLPVSLLLPFSSFLFPFLLLVFVRRAQPVETEAPANNIEEARQTKIRTESVTYLLFYFDEAVLLLCYPRPCFECMSVPSIYLFILVNYCHLCPFCPSLFICFGICP